MESLFTLKISENQLTAELVLKKLPDSGNTVSLTDLYEFIASEKVVYGIKKEVTEIICQDLHKVTFPVIIAEGKAPIGGKNGYLQNELGRNLTEEKRFNVRNILEIPSVTEGQLLATIVPEKSGIAGMSVTGRKIAATNGKPLKIRADKSVSQIGQQFFAAINGQLTLTESSISVNPVFVVEGDLDIKTGNLDFAGNIVIKGNIPGGYKLKSGGDIRVLGIVEGASLEANGNIIVESGITGGTNGIVSARGSIHAAYLNNAMIKAGENVSIKSSILHSKVIAAGKIECSGGHVIGGLLAAGKDIFIKELGNELYTKTELHIGWNPVLQQQEEALLEELRVNNESLCKLNEIESKLIHQIKSEGKLSQQQRLILSKQKSTQQHLHEKIAKNKEQLQEIRIEKKAGLEAALYIYGHVYPNTKIYFDKYVKMTNQQYKNVTFKYEDTTINIYPNENF
ncbi:FapA family protein [Mesobacillus harenae]|uniref:FapA family protein n=1 Tax=Mesobacillus harenae TaxID=2213203 RepID=UPI00158121FF